MSGGAIVLVYWSTLGKIDRMTRTISDSQQDNQTMQIQLDPASRVPLYQQLANTVLQRIRSGALPAGTRLPTVCQLARQLGVTRLTVHSAYAELQADGWVEATVGRGTFVAEHIEELLAPPETTLGREVTPAGVFADMLRSTQIPGLLSLARADPAPELLPVRQWQQASEMALTAEGAALMSYTTAQGDIVLRATLAELLRERGLTASPDEIVITTGVTQGIALATEILAPPGALVLVEQPTYLGVLGTLATRGLQIRGIPLDEEGLIIEAVEATLQRERPAFLYTIPAFQNPAGVCMSPARRAALLDLAGRYNLMIVEDDIYGRLCYEGPAPITLKADDHAGRVVYLSSFSKSLMPGLRIGYALAAPALVERMVQARQAHDICSPPLLQRALATFIEQGWLHAHHRRVLPHYRTRRDALLQAMERFFPPGITWTRPHGGFSCWVTLPAGLSVRDLYLSAINRGMAFTPGEVFGLLPDDQPHLRLCYGAESPERITDAVATLGGLLRETRTHQPLPRTNLGDYVPLV
jgi:DNA-binding transcriptional MocR family regulator